MQYGIAPFEDLAPGNVMRRLGGEIAGVERGIEEMKRDLLAFEDIANLKRWLQEMRRRSREVDLDDIPF
jgi:hypothetical protein